MLRAATTAADGGALVLSHILVLGEDLIRTITQKDVTVVWSLSLLEHPTPSHTSSSSVAGDVAVYPVRVEMKPSANIARSVTLAQTLLNR